MSLIDDFLNASREKLGLTGGSGGPSPLDRIQPTEMAPDAGERLRNAPPVDNSALRERFAPPQGAPVNPNVAPGTPSAEAAAFQAEGGGRALPDQRSTINQAGERLRNAPAADPSELRARLAANQPPAPWQPTNPNVNPGILSAEGADFQAEGGGRAQPPQRSTINVAGDRLRNAAMADTQSLRERFAAGQAPQPQGPSLADLRNAPPQQGGGLAEAIRARAGFSDVNGGPPRTPGTQPAGGWSDTGGGRAGAPAGGWSDAGPRAQGPYSDAGPAPRTGPAPTPTPEQASLAQRLRSMFGLGDGGAAAPGAAAPGAAPNAASGPNALQRGAQAAFGTAEQWANSPLVKVGGQVVNTAAKTLKAAAAPLGAIETYAGIRDGDTNKAAWGAADTAAGLALYSPAAPVAGAYLTGRGAYEGYQALPERFRDNIDNSVNAAGQLVDRALGTKLGNPDAPAWQRMLAGVEADKAGKPGAPAAAPAAASQSGNVSPNIPAGTVTEDEADNAALAKINATNAANEKARNTGDPIGMAARQRLQAELANENAVAEKNGVVAMGMGDASKPETTYYRTADGRTITPPAPLTDADKQLLQRVSVVEPQGKVGSAFEQDGKQYVNVRAGTDPNGMEVVKAISVDGKNAVGGADAVDLINKYNEATKRANGLPPEDARMVAEFNDRDARRKAIDTDLPDVNPPGAQPGTAAPRVQTRLAGGRDTIGAKAADHTPFSFVADENERRNFQIMGHAVASVEGGDYNKLVGGKSFDGFDKHPGIVGMKTKDGPSTAAGRYMITGTTFKDVGGKNSIQDFSPDSQDRMFTALLARNNALDDVRKGDFDTAMQKIGGTWQGVPSGASKNQGKRTPAEWQAALNEGRSLYAGNGMPTTVGEAPQGNFVPVGAQQPRQAQQPAAPGFDGTGAVQIIRPGGEETIAVPNGPGGMTELSSAAYDAYRQAQAAAPGTAGRAQLTDAGPMVGGVPIPPMVLAQGDKAVSDYIANAQQGLQYAVNPHSGKIAEEVAKATAGKQRYLQLGGGTDPNTGMTLPQVAFDTVSGKPVDMKEGQRPTTQQAHAEAQKAISGGADKKAINQRLTAQGYPALR